LINGLGKSDQSTGPAHETKASKVSYRPQNLLFGALLTANALRIATILKPHPHGPPNQLGQISYDVPYSRNFHQRLNEMVVTGTHSVDCLPIIHWIFPDLSGLLA
jgi:hypothetical protein